MTEDTRNRYRVTTSLQPTGLDQGVEYKVRVRALGSTYPFGNSLLPSRTLSVPRHPR